jgi:carbonic anhydrase/acetyltransferase-like protein (isoleucine patch superfamily)
MSLELSKEKRTELNLVAEVARRLASGGLAAADVQALLEGRSLGPSSMDDKLVGIWEGVRVTEGFLRQTMILQSSGQVLRRHRNGGGWVPAEQDEYDESKPFVAETAYVGPRGAMVTGRARVYDEARVENVAHVEGSARLHNQARVFDYASVYDDAQVRGRAQVGGATNVCGNSQVFDRAAVLDDAEVGDEAQVFDDANVSGCARVYDRAKAFGYAHVYGDAELRDFVQACGNVRIFGEVTIGGKTKLDQGEYSQ